MKDILLMREHIKEAIDEADDDIVERVFKLIKENDEDDFEDPLENLTPEQEADFLLSLKQADRGETIAHEEVMKRYEKWITKYFGFVKHFKALIKLSTIWKRTLQIRR